MSLRYQPGIRCLAGALALASVGSARAHSFGDGGAYDQFIQGLAAPATLPANLLLLASTGAMIGLWPGGGIGRMLPFMAFGALLGLLAGSLLPTPMNPAAVSWLLLSTSIVIAGLAIAAQPWPRPLTGAMALAATGLCAGYTFIDHASGEVPLATQAGNLAGIFLGIVLVNNVITLTCDRWRQAWVGIGFRVAASWLCAIAILLLAFTLRP